MTFDFTVQSGAKYTGFFGPGASRRFKRFSGYRLAEIENKGDESDFAALAYFAIQVHNEANRLPALTMTCDEFIDSLSFKDIATISATIAAAAEEAERIAEGEKKTKPAPRRTARTARK